MASSIVAGIRAGDAIGGPTQLARLVHQSVMARRSFDRDDLTLRYLAWWRNGAFDSGPTFDLVFRRISKGVDRDEAVVAVDKLMGGMTAGCGPAHRNSPLAECPFIRTEDLAGVARQEARITHLHPHAGDAAAVVVMLCRRLLDGQSWQAAKDSVGMRSETAPAFQAVMARSLSPSGYAPDAVRAAIHFMDDERSLERAKLFAGGQNYCPVILGALIGAASSRSCAQPG